MHHCVKLLTGAALALSAHTASGEPLSYSSGLKCTHNNVAGVYTHSLRNPGTAGTTPFAALAVYELRADGTFVIRNKVLSEAIEGVAEQAGTGIWAVDADCHGSMNRFTPHETWAGITVLFVASPKNGILHMIDNTFYQAFVANKVH